MAEFDVIVLGGGLSGTQAAMRVAELGGKVCLIEKEKVGKKGFLKRNILFTKHRYGNGYESIKWSEQSNKQEKLAEEYSDSLKEKLEKAGVLLVEGDGILASANEVLVQRMNKSQLIKYSNSDKNYFNQIIKKDEKFSLLNEPDIVSVFFLFLSFCIIY